ncbi:MAG TPA: hypothetical protein VHJ78_06480 [Actinomycetota bacterium]|nr:hypothetical protein [Actinomycetota bacterium]
MRRRLTLLCLLAIALALAPAPAMAVAASGRVVMGTAGAPLPGGLRVTVLQNSQEGQPEGQPAFAPVGPDGTFTFEADPAKGHLVGLFYSGAAYSRVLEPGETSGIELKIFEPTNDPSVVKVASDSMTILQSEAEGQSDVLEVLQLMRFRNDSDRTFAGTQADAPATADGGVPQARPVLRLPVPESAFELAPADPGNGAGLATEGGRLLMTSPLVPGETSVAYLYKVKVPRSGWQLRREIYFPTDHFDLLIGKSLNLGAAPGFRFAETARLGGQEYDRYRSASRNPGAVLEADVGFTGASSNNGLWIGFTAVAVVLAGVFAAASLRMRRRRAAARATPAAEQAAGSDASPTREQLIEQVAALDEEFDAGGMDEKAYRARRKLLLARLNTPAETLE